MPYEIERTELVWPGKYDADGVRVAAPRVSLPFQVIERVNESRAARETEKSHGLSLFDVWAGDAGETFEDGWRNKLIWGDNLLVMSSLLNQFAGKVDLIYIDPPFATGADFTFEAEIGGDGERVEKERSLVEEKAYRDTWANGVSSYLEMLVQRLDVMRSMLADTGSIYIHVDPTVGHYVKVAADAVFGRDCFQREIVWRIGWISGYKSAAKNWIRNHDTILFYSKRASGFRFNKEYIPYPPGYKRRGGSEPTGRGYPIEDVWNANEFEFALTGDESLDSIQIKSFSTEKTGYPTQKNLSLLKRIIRSATDPGDLVFDGFAGSGTTAVAAEQLGRRWIATDLGRFAVHTTRKRLLDVPECRPFEVLNLGQYERQHWKVATFGEDLDGDGAISLYEYLAFVLRLYGAQPISGMQHLHGRRDKAFVHVGAVDAPVTIAEIEAAVAECIEVGGTELHILGWEWEMGLHDPLEQLARHRGVKLVNRQIPREIMEKSASDRGDVKFFELAYVEVKVAKKRRTVSVKLEEFVIPNPELVPDEVRSKITKWSDYVDYWAVDWDFSDDTFMQSWVTFRTRKDRSLELRSDEHEYAEAGAHRIMVKVIDIFGNDTSKILEIEVA